MNIQKTIKKLKKKTKTKRDEQNVRKLDQWWEDLGPEKLGFLKKAQTEEER